MAAPSINLSRYPLVTVTFQGVATEAEFDEYLAGMTRMIIERKKKTVTILDARDSGRPPPSQRKKQAEWLKEHQNMLRQYSLGTAFVITSPLVRGVLTAIFWLQTMPNEHTVVSTVYAAEKWALARFDAVGLSVPAAAEGRVPGS